MSKRTVEVEVMLPKLVKLEVEYDEEEATFDILSAEELTAYVAGQEEIKERVYNCPDNTYGYILEKLENQ